jgi:hypothetical protein
MVGTYLVCEHCGKFGPPASFISENGVRLCYQCFYQEDEAGEEKPESKEETKEAQSNQPHS